MPWIEAAPAFLVFLANGRRLPLIAGMRGKPFPNDHLDLFFNAVAGQRHRARDLPRVRPRRSGSAACPISAIRDHAAMVSALLELPERVVPVAGLCVGWPAEDGHITPRLPLAATVHHDRYRDQDPLASQIDAYDRRRAAVRPYAQAAAGAALRRGDVLRVVGGQGAAIRRAAARRLRRVRAEERVWFGLECVPKTRGSMSGFIPKPQSGWRRSASRLAIMSLMIRRARIAPVSILRLRSTWSGCSLMERC